MQPPRAIRALRTLIAPVSRKSQGHSIRNYRNDVALTTRKQLQLWFQWKLQGVAEVAYLQIETGRAMTTNPRSPELAELFGNLLRLPKYLSARYRRWYYRVAEAVQLHQLKDRLSPEPSYRDPQRRTSEFVHHLLDSSCHDVFISYAREDLADAAQIAKLLVSEGFSVWWDRYIAPGDEFGRSIEGALAKSRCVVVLWSRHSVTKRWVLAEAEEGATRGILVPVRLQNVTIPLGFRPIQAIDILTTFESSESLERYYEWRASYTTSRNLVRRIKAMLGDPPEKEVGSASD